MIDLSICIPTYNRTRYLENCLESIKIASENSNLLIEVCVSDNNSEEKVIPIIDDYKKKINLIFNQNQKNIGLAKNILKSVSLASGRFAWLIGNDDIILPNAFSDLDTLLKKNTDIDFYYINSFQADEKILNENFSLDFSKINLSLLKKCSNYKKSEKLKFFQLIDPRKSFDFMLGIWLCIFRLKYWKNNISIIDEKKISDPRLFANFDNTAPHVKIWSAGFNDKLAYFLSKPLTINIHGPRAKDWRNLYPFVEGIRMPQILDCYRKDGMSFLRYIICKNYALRRFLPSILNMIKNRKKSGLELVNIYDDIIKNLIYPSIYIAGIYFLIRKILIIIKNFLFRI